MRLCGMIHRFRLWGSTRTGAKLDPQFSGSGDEYKKRAAPLGSRPFWKGNCRAQAGENFTTYRPEVGELIPCSPLELCEGNLGAVR